MSEKVLLRISLASAGLLVALAVFSVGFLAGYYERWPTQTFRDIKAGAISFWGTGDLHFTRQIVRAPAGQSSNRVVIHAPEALLPGNRIFLGYEAASKTYHAWLISADGEELHSWPLNYPGAEDLGRKNVAHGLVALPDGSLAAIFSFKQGGGIIRYDTCGDVIWQNLDAYHHQISIASDGNIWTTRGEIDFRSYSQFFEKIDAETGEVLKSVSLSDDIIGASDANALALSVFPEAGEVFRKQSDIFHINDIEELHPDMADAFPLFEAGQLLVSLRNTQMVAVIDPDTASVVWTQSGPWVMHHDPDFQPDGTISIYNNAHYVEGRPAKDDLIGRSSILTVDPVTREVKWAVGGPKGPHFYSEIMGTHQRLPDGSWLYTVPDQGQAFELGPDLSPRLEFNNTVNDVWNGRVSNAIWVPPDFYEQIPTCDR